MPIKYQFMVGVITLLLLSSFSHNQGKINPDVTEIDFAVFISQSGGNSIYASTIYNAVELAVDEINNFTETQFLFNMIVYDPTGFGGPSGAMTQALSDNVSFVIGPISSAQTLDVAQYGPNNQIPIISYGASYPEIAEFDDHAEGGDEGYLWRTSFNQKNLGTVVGQFIDTQNFNKIGLLSIPINQIFYDAYDDITIAMTQQLSSQELFNITVGQNDMESGLNTILDENPDVLYLLMETRLLIPTLNLIQEKNIETPIIADANAINPDELFSPVGLNTGAAKGVFFIGAESIHESEVANNYYSKFEAKYGIADPYAAYFASRAYDATYAAALAIINGGSSSGPNIIEQLSLLNFEGATGTVQFDDHGDRKIDYFDFFVGGVENWTRIGKHESTGVADLDSEAVIDFLNGRGDSGDTSTPSVPQSTTSAEPLTLPVQLNYILMGLVGIQIIRRKNAYK